MRYLRLLVLAAFFPVQLFAFSAGPWTGNNGTEPQNRTCAVCHDSFELNSGSGELLWNVPGEYVPGQTYTLEVELADPAASRWGFQFVATYLSTLAAGQVTLTDTVNTQVLVGFNPNPTEHFGEFVSHTTQGTYANTSGSASWSFEWTAPDPGVGEIVFYLAGNAADGDNTDQGDRIYAISDTAGEATMSAPEPELGVSPESFAIRSVYPNPFNASTRIRATLPSATTVGGLLYDALGRQVAQLAPRAFAAGEVAFNWSPQLPSGVYLLLLETGQGQRDVARITLLK